LIAEVRGKSGMEQEPDEQAPVHNEEESQNPAEGEPEPRDQYQMKVEDSDDEVMIVAEDLNQKKGVAGQCEKTHKTINDASRDAIMAKILHLKEKIALKRIVGHVLLFCNRSNC
jgi:hypothetical protein